MVAYSHALKRLPLLLENPPFVLAPYVELSQDVTKTNEEREEKNLFNCDVCGRVLDSSYYLSIGIPPSPLIIVAYECESLNYEKNIKLEWMTSWIQSVAKNFDIDNKYQWIFSEQNIMSSKTRICVSCQGKYKWKLRLGDESSTIRVRRVCSAIEEYQRLHTHISTAKSDYERYILSLPDRTNSYRQHFGDADLNSGDGLEYYSIEVRECLTIALIPDYKPADPLSQEFRTNFIQDKNRVIPNDQELTRWMKKQTNDYYDRHDYYDDWFRIQFCKIFINPKKLKYHVDRGDGKMIHSTRYTVVVHYSVPKGDWDVCDI